MAGSIKPSETPGREAISELVDGFILARAKFDVEALQSLIDYNALLVMIGDAKSIYPFANRTFGRDAIVELITAFKISFECGGNEILNKLIDGDTACVLRKATYIHRGSGKSKGIHIAEWLRFRLGRIVEIKLLCDNEAVRRLLDDN